MRTASPKIFCLAISIFVFGLGATSFAEDSKNPKDWYERARADFEVAQLLFEKTNHYGIVCFHAHQAAEKALKGALIGRGVLPGKFHYTAELAENFSRFDPKASEWVASCKELDRIYVPSRYPKNNGVEFTREAALNCIQNARPAVDFVLGEAQVEPQIKSVN